MSKFVFVLITNGTIRSSSNATYLLPGQRGTYAMYCLVGMSLGVLGMFIIGYGLWPILFFGFYLISMSDKFLEEEIHCMLGHVTRLLVLI